MSSPQVSVVIPNYNHARFLEKRIRSVLNQTYTDFEVLYLDDASTDNSAQVFAPFAVDPRIQVLLNECNGGTPFKQWNKGVRAARGKYVWLAEADDYADPELLATLVPILDENPSVGIAFCQSWKVDENNVTMGLDKNGWDVEPTFWQSDFVMKGALYAQKFMAIQNTIPNASGVLFRKSVYEAAGHANEKMRLTGDWLMWHKMLRLSDIAFVARPLNFFRFHPTSVRSQSAKAGMLAAERYEMTRHVKRTLPLTAAQIEIANHNNMDFLRNGFFLATNKRDWHYYHRLLRAARRTDPRFHARFMRHLGYQLLHGSPIFESMRSLGRKLWRTFVSA